MAKFHAIIEQLWRTFERMSTELVSDREPDISGQRKALHKEFDRIVGISRSDAIYKRQWSIATTLLAET